MSATARGTTALTIQIEFKTFLFSGNSVNARTITSSICCLNKIEMSYLISGEVTTTEV